MRFGIREICDVVLRAKSYQTLGNRKFYKNEPVLYFDTLRTSTLEGAATTVYAQGGRGYTRLIAWEGERTLTFTMEDALLSPESFSILSGAGLLDATEDKPIYVHQTSQVEVKEENTIVVPDLTCWNNKAGMEVKGGRGTVDDYYESAADIFVMTLDGSGQVNAEPCIPVKAVYDETAKTTTLTCYSHAGTLPADSVVLIDYYVKRIGGAQTIEITADKFGGNYYLEASTLFRRESDGVDMPAEFIIPNCKVQSNFTFSMAANGDPSTFTFTMDAFPDYTKFDKTHKVLAAIQVINEEGEEADDTRQPCTQGRSTFNYSSYNGVTGLDIIKTGTDTNVQLAITGELAADADNLYDTAEFGTLSVDAVEMDFDLPVKADKTYTIKQENPGLNTLYPGSFPTNIKEKDYTGQLLLDEPYQIVLTEGKSPVKITVTQKDTQKVIMIINIINSVTFA